MDDICLMCRYGDVEDGEVCLVATEEIITYKPCWVRVPALKKRVVVEMKVPVGEYYHRRLGRQPRQGRARRVITTRFLNADGSVDDQVEICGTDQAPRNDGSIVYVPGCETRMNERAAKERKRFPHYPGIHFHFDMKDVVCRV